MTKPQILLTNDDGIRSHGLWTAAAALSKLGFVHVAAPREQSSGAGRSMPGASTGQIEVRQVNVDGQEWTVHAVGGTPAQTVLHAVLEIMPERPQLVVAGINYGENLGSGVTVSGTVGAALEAASLGVPAIAVSLQVEPHHHFSLSDEVDFTAAAYFTAYFGRLMLSKKLPPDVDVLKIEVPCNATPDTPWAITRLSRMRYYEPTPPGRRDWNLPVRVGYQVAPQVEQDDPLTDIYAVSVRGWVSVTPLSLDLTSRIELGALDEILRAG